MSTHTAPRAYDHLTALDWLRLEHWDHGDAYGSVMGLWFGVASVLYVRGEAIPTHWEFKPAMALTEDAIREDEMTPDIDVLNALESGQITVSELVDLGNWLCRLHGELTQRGMDY